MKRQTPNPKLFFPALAPAKPKKKDGSKKKHLTFLSLSVCLSLSLSIPIHLFDIQAVRKARPLHESVHDRTLLDLMQQMLVLSSQDRITAADALLHPFFAQE